MAQKPYRVIQWATGITATDDIEAMIALDADCVHFAPMIEDIDLGVSSLCL